MDEPTSELDPLSEYKIYKELFKEVEDKTIVLLTHRLGVCELVDKIIVLRVYESGTHDELIMRGRYYRQLYESQKENAYRNMFVN